MRIYSVVFVTCGMRMPTASVNQLQVGGVIYDLDIRKKQFGTAPSQTI